MVLNPHLGRTSRYSPQEQFILGNKTPSKPEIEINVGEICMREIAQTGRAGNGQIVASPFIHEESLWRPHGRLFERKYIP